ncbi:MAG TPA: M14 family zinc carboxypeptidase [Thermoanaerobaculia bacterium]|nr:M14 family zinc carboxypeptidase [Thermoanaerobaculia bacterium]
MKALPLLLAALLAPLPGAASGPDAAVPGDPSGALPEDHRTLTKSTSYDAMAAFLKAIDGKGPVAVSVEGSTAQGRSLFLVHARGSAAPTFRVLFYAQQHGDEVSGKDALLYLLRDLARDPKLLPPEVDLWVMPMVNPDGAEAGTRRNSAGADLNRDHVTLFQPETEALHRVARRVRPHLAVDAHEFGRDQEEWTRKGWEKWPDITMDGLNNPHFDRERVAAAKRWVDASAAPLEKAGHRFLRYWVGGAPPDDEQRHSAPDADGGLNGIGAYGGLSFIIEAAVRHEAPNPQADLGKRVDAYLVLFRRFLEGGGRRAEDRAVVEKAWARPLPAFLPSDALWVNPDGTVTEFPVVELATAKTIRVPTANVMTDVAVKRSVPTPRGYAVEPAAAPEIGALLARHGLGFEKLAAPRTVTAESCALLRVEEEFDDLYGRYGGRTIVKRGAAKTTELPAGSLWVPLEGPDALRAAILLEPTAMYGLWQYPRLKALVAWDGTIPVRRVVALAAPAGAPR